MRFRYASYEVEPSLTVPDGVLYRPEIVIDVIGSRRTETIQALVDTGSDETVFPMSLARAIGVQLERDATGQASAVGGHAIELVPGSVTLEITQADVTYRWDAVVQFLDVDQPEDEVALLGFAGFLEFFKATFDGDSRELQLTAGSRLRPLN